jgi:hypothetical protein
LIALKKRGAEQTTIDRLPSREEIDAYGAAAEKFYAPLRERLEAEHWGKYVTIYPVNGDYALAHSHRAAVNKMRKKYPGVAFCSYRIGYRAVFHFEIH